MKTNKHLVGDILCAVISVAIVLVCALNSFGITYSRFNKIAISSYVYGENYSDKISLSADGKIFDFGLWETGNSESFSHTVVFNSDTKLEGKLRFVWDSVTASKKDITVLLSENVLSDGVCNVDQADGRLELPFSLVFSSTTRSGVAYLDVEWIPVGSDKATATARYFVTLNAESIAGGNSEKPSFNVAETRFLTNNLLKVSLNPSGNMPGAVVSVGASLLNKFNKGTVYFTEAYPQGIKLLRDSVLYLQKGGNGKIEGIIDLGVTSKSFVNITAGASASSYATTSQSPGADCFDVTLDQSVNQPILSHTNQLKFIITEPLGFVDDLWNSNGSSEAETVWYIERLENGVYKKINPNQNLSVLVSRNSSGGSLTLSASTGRQPAGTYKLTVTQTIDGYAVGKKSFTFFIDYR